MYVESLHTWQSPNQLLEKLRQETYASNTKPIRDLFKEAWVIAKFARLVFPEDGKCQVKLNQETFPDAIIKINSSDYDKYIEITQAFEGGDNSPSRPSRFDPFLENQLVTKPEDFMSAAREELLKGLKLAIDRKVAKHYAAKPNLLIYVNNIPTFGLAEEIIEAHHEEFLEYKKYFKSINVLTCNARHAIQILPNFKVFHDTLH